MQKSLVSCPTCKKEYKNAHTYPLVCAEYWQNKPEAKETGHLQRMGKKELDRREEVGQVCEGEGVPHFSEHPRLYNFGF